MNRLFGTAITVLAAGLAVALAVVLGLALGVSVARADPVPVMPAPGHFGGKFELVPLFDKGKPVQRNGHSYYALVHSISYTTAAGDTMTAFAGSRTDLASIPPYLWATMPPDGPWAEAAVIHDALFRSSGTLVWYGHVGRTRATPYTRAEANEILRQAMVTLGVPAWKRIAIYEGVQAGKFLAPQAWCA
jgi:hypothetical protein